MSRSRAASRAVPALSEDDLTVSSTAARAVVKSAPMLEEDFRGRVIDYAKLRGWKAVAYRPAKTEKGWRTPLQGDKGCPDIILARRGVVLLVELKSATGRPTPEQRAWLDALGGNGRLWRPVDWGEIVTELK